jgi:hypothetical protein
MDSIFCKCVVTVWLCLRAGLYLEQKCSGWNAQSHSCVYGLNLQNNDQKHS